MNWRELELETLAVFLVIGLIFVVGCVAPQTEEPIEPEGVETGSLRIIVLDEAGLFVSSTQSTSRRVRTLKQLTYIIRHLNASIMFIAQSRKSLVPDLRESLVTYQLQMKKISTDNRRMIVSKPMPYIAESGEEVYDFGSAGFDV